MAYRAEKIEDLDWTFHRDGELRRETLVKRVLSEGTWPVIAYLYRNVNGGVPEARKQIMLIRYGRKKSKWPRKGDPEGAEPVKMWVPHHRLNLPSASLAWKIAAQILEWAPPEEAGVEGLQPAGGLTADLVRFLREAADMSDAQATEKSRQKRRATWKRKRMEKKEAEANGEGKVQIKAKLQIKDKIEDKEEPEQG